MKVKEKIFILSIMIGFVSAGCAKDEQAEGLRINILDQIESHGSTVPIDIPNPVIDYDDKKLQIVNGKTYNYIFRSEPQFAWKLDLNIGKILSSLKTKDSQIIVLGDQGTLKCVDLVSKKTLWSRSILPINSKKMLVGGGLSADSFGNLYVASSFGEIRSISIKQGTLNWNYKVDAPIMEAPSVIGKNIFLVDTSNVLRSISYKGILNWSVSGISSNQIRNNTGKPTPAGALVLFPLSSGLLTAVDPLSGLRKWGFKYNLSRTGYTDNAFGAFSGDPVVNEKIIYYGSVTGQFNALKLNGEVLWQAGYGLKGRPLIISNSLFFVTDTNKLIRVNKRDGSIIWSKNLDKNKNTYFGPLLLDSKLWIVSSDGELSSYEVQKGDLLSRLSINSEISSYPIFHNKTVILSTNSGELIGFN